MTRVLASRAILAAAGLACIGLCLGAVVADNFITALGWFSLGFLLLAPALGDEAVG